MTLCPINGASLPKLKETPCTHCRVTKISISISRMKEDSISGVAVDEVGGWNPPSHEAWQRRYAKPIFVICILSLQLFFSLLSDDQFVFFILQNQKLDKWNLILIFWEFTISCFCFQGTLKFLQCAPSDLSSPTFHLIRRKKIIKYPLLKLL